MKLSAWLEKFVSNGLCKEAFLKKDANFLDHIEKFLNKNKYSTLEEVLADLKERTGLGELEARSLWRNIMVRQAQEAPEPEYEVPLEMKPFEPTKITPKVVPPEAAIPPWMVERREKEKEEWMEKEPKHIRTFMKLYTKSEEFGARAKFWDTVEKYEEKFGVYLKRDPKVSKPLREFAERVVAYENRFGAEKLTTDVLFRGTPGEEEFVEVTTGSIYESLYNCARRYGVKLDAHELDILSEDVKEKLGQKGKAVFRTDVLTFFEKGINPVCMYIKNLGKKGKELYNETALRNMIPPQLWTFNRALRTSYLEPLHVWPTFVDDVFKEVVEDLSETEEDGYPILVKVNGGLYRVNESVWKTEVRRKIIAMFQLRGELGYTDDPRVDVLKTVKKVASADDIYENLSIEVEGNEEKLYDALRSTLISVFSKAVPPEDVIPPAIRNDEFAKTQFIVSKVSKARGKKFENFSEVVEDYKQWVKQRKNQT